MGIREAVLLCTWSMPGLAFCNNYPYEVVKKLEFQEHSIGFNRTEDVDMCHKFCGEKEHCNWWSFEPYQKLCILFTNCTKNGSPDQVACPSCISGERL